MPDVNMPKLSDTMEEGTIVEWKKSSGDEVHKGEVLAEVESDKATFDLEAEEDGRLEILVEKGVPARIGAPIARIGSEAKGRPRPPEPAPQAEAPSPHGGEEAKKDKPKAESAEPAQAAEPAGQEAPEATPAEAKKPESKQRPRPAEPAAQAEPPSPQDGEVRASPLARRLAEEMGVDLASVKGTGPEGRIVKEDVVAAAGSERKERRRTE